jgi:hypothetical protein
MTATTRQMTAAQLIRRFGKPLASVALLTATLLPQPIMAQPSNQAPATTVPADKMVAIEDPRAARRDRARHGPVAGRDRARGVAQPVRQHVCAERHRRHPQALPSGPVEGDRRRR